MVSAPMIKYILKRDRFIFAFSAMALLIGQVFLPDAQGPEAGVWLLPLSLFHFVLWVEHFNVRRTIGSARLGGRPAY